MAVHHPASAAGPAVDVDEAFFVVVLNTNPYTYVGARPFNLAPDATLDRALAAVSVRTLRVVPFLGLVGSALFSGRHLRQSRHAHYRADVQEVTVTGHRPFPYQVDGDYLGETEELVLRHVPAVLSLVRPTPP
jgi:diacylglycerol kinase family enzyme